MEPGNLLSVHPLPKNKLPPINNPRITPIVHRNMTQSEIAMTPQKDMDDSSIDNNPPMLQSDFKAIGHGYSFSPAVSPIKILNGRDFEEMPNQAGTTEKRSFTISKDVPAMWEFENTELPNFPTETQTLRILAVTWNMYGKKPTKGLDQLLNTEKVKHHIISVGTEECLRSIPASAFIESKSYWVNMLRKHLDKEYVMLKSHSMNALHFAVFVHRSIIGVIKNIESSEVRTGIGNVLGNKGGIGICFKVYGTSFLFINCHLSSGQNQVRRRNEDFRRIMEEMELPKARVTGEKKMKQKSTILDRFDFVFWSGDFNYRVNQTRENTIHFVKEHNFADLLEQDQFNLEKKNTDLFAGFQEGDITFPPTYKYQVESDLFDVKKKRVPSWTDRILFASQTKLLNIQQLNYQSLHNVRLSDHRPVYSQFIVSVEDIDQEQNQGLVKAKTNFCNIF